MRYPSRFPVLVMLEHRMMPLTEEHFEIFGRVVEFVAVAVMHDLHRLEVALEELFGKDSVNPAGFVRRACGCVGTGLSWSTLWLWLYRIILLWNYGIIQNPRLVNSRSKMFASNS